MLREQNVEAIEKIMEWEKIDEEWVALIIEAKNSGLSINDVREFLTDPNTILSIYR